MKSYWVSVFRMLPKPGTVEQQRVEVYEVRDWSAGAAIRQLTKAQPGLLVSTVEFLSASPVPPIGWADKVKQVEAAQ